MTEQPRKYVPQTRGRPFEPGNPGRPRGSRNKATLAMEALLDGGLRDSLRWHHALQDHLSCRWDRRNGLSQDNGNAKNPYPDSEKMVEVIPPARDEKGRLQKGSVLNPTGRGRAGIEVRQLCRELTPAAIDALKEALKVSKTRVKAAEVILGYAWGKPAQLLTDGEGGQLKLEITWVKPEEVSEPKDVTPAIEGNPGIIHAASPAPDPQSDAD